MHAQFTAAVRPLSLRLQQQQPRRQQAKQGWNLFGRAAAPAVQPASIAAAAAGGAELVCIEFTRDRRRVYRQQPGAGSSADGSAAPESAAGARATAGKRRGKGKEQRSRGADGSRRRSTAGGWEITDDAVRGRQRLGDLVSDYLLPQGYPHSVGPGEASCCRALPVPLPGPSRAAGGPPFQFAYFFLARRIHQLHVLEGRAVLLWRCAVRCALRPLCPSSTSSTCLLACLIGVAGARAAGGERRGRCPCWDPAQRPASCSALPPACCRHDERRRHNEPAVLPQPRPAG